MVYKYDWKVNLYPSVAAEAAGKHIESLQEEQGTVTCENLLDSARPDESVIHPCYEWDDSIAAEKYRLGQSKNILSNLVRVEVTEEESAEPKVTRAFVNVVEPSGINEHGKYVRIETAMSDGEMRSIVLRRALNELAMFRKKYADLSELARVFDAIREVENASNDKARAS